MTDQPRVLNPVTLNWSQENIHKDFRPRVMPASTPRVEQPTDPDAVPADVQREIDEEYGESPLDPQAVPTQLEEVTTSPIGQTSSASSEPLSRSPQNPGWKTPPARPSAPATEATPIPGSPARESKSSGTTQNPSAGLAP